MSHMRKILIVIFLIAIFSVAFLAWSSKSKTTLPVSQKTSSENISHGKSPEEEYIIVPYWTLSADVSTAPFDNLMYFGISATEQGIDTSEDGYKRLPEFIQNSEGKKTYLVVRMLNQDANMKILENKNAQKRIISESVRIAKENEMEGVVLDLEIQGIPFESFVSTITDFNKDFFTAVKGENLFFGTFIYGDAYFRARPFNISEIGKNVDSVFIMAYDFSKARGNPGPNFPLEEGNYGYSFKTMIQDFMSQVPKQKLTVVFGMFGYDWTIDKERRGKGQASAKSTLEFQKFITLCVSENSCKVKINNASETQITYEKESESHEIWFESENSVEKKIEYLRNQGINSIGYWAYSYF